MPKPFFRLPSFAQLAEKLFGGSLTSNYLVAAVVVVFCGGYLTFSPSSNTLPMTAKALIMMGTMVGSARLFNSPSLRLAWLGLFALLSVIPLLDVVRFLAGLW